MTKAEAERSIRERLDNWKFWVGVAYFGLALLVVWLFFLNQDIAREQAARTATAKANAVSTRDNCYRMVDNNPDLLSIITAIRLTSRNSIATSKAALRLAPDGALSDVRRASIKRNQRAMRAADKFRAQIVQSTPTEQRCDELALRLGLAPRNKEGP